MKNKILIDNFDYRFKQKEKELGYTFASPGLNRLSFDKVERHYFVSKILNSLITHDSVLIRITSIFDLIELFNLKDAKSLLESRLIEVIDDGGIVKIQNIDIRQKNKETLEEVDLLRFGNTFQPDEAFTLESIEETLDKEFSGKLINKSTKPFLQHLEDNKINLD